MKFKRDYLFWLIKIGVSLISFFIIYSVVDGKFDELIPKEFSAGWFLLAMLAFGCAQFFCGLRCAHIAAEFGCCLPFARAMKAYYVGLWFNNILPTGLGGDVVRTALISRCMPFQKAALVVLMDRFFGAFIIFLTVSILTPFYAHFFSESLPLCLLSIGLVFGIAVFSFAMEKLKRIIQHPALKKVAIICASGWRFHEIKPLSRQLFLSLMVQTGGVVAYGLLGLSIGININFIYYFLIVPIIFLISALPISLGGWGPREVGTMWLFHLADVPDDLSLQLSVTFGFFLVICGLPGLIFFLMDKKIRECHKTWKDA